VRAGHGVSPLLGALVEKITLFHLHLAGLRLMLGAASHRLRRLPDHAKMSIA
jgi:hypothetical protein